MPFAGRERRVPRPPERRRPGLLPQQPVVHVKEGLPGQKHRPGRDARRGLEAALHIGAGKGQALPAQPIQVRRADDRIAKRGNGIRALVVVEEDKDARFVRCEPQLQQQQRNHPGK